MKVVGKLLNYLFISGIAILFALGCAPVSKAQLGNDTIKSADVAAQTGDYSAPRDAVPTADGSVIYFTATTSGGGGVLRVPAAGGQAVVVAAGAPFVTPNGIQMSADGAQIYVADPGAMDANGKMGQVWIVSATGGTVTPLTGTAGTSARGLAIASENGSDVLYFTGQDPNDGQPALMKIPVDDPSTPQVVFKGVPLVMPDAVAVTAKGIVYLSDRMDATGAAGSVFRIANGNAEKIADKVRLGDPGGLALTLDDGVLLVSSINSDKATDQVLLINLATNETGVVTKVVEANRDAGGVHRARNVNVFAWADSTAGGQGRVYRITPN